MKFRLWTILWAFALLASAMATFGTEGFVYGALVIGFWSSSSSLKRLYFMLLVVALLVSVMFYMTLPTVNGDLEPPEHHSCSSSLQVVARSVLSYSLSHGAFLPVRNSTWRGGPPVAWRLRVLPYLEHGDLQKNYKYDVAWDDPNNTAVTSTEVGLLFCPTDRTGRGDNRSSYFAVVGEETLWPETVQRRLSDIKDGSAQTIMLIEAGGRDVKWAEPRDLSFQEAVKLLSTGSPANTRDGHRVDNGFFYRKRFVRNVAFADSSVRSLTMPLTEELATALLTIDGGEDVDMSQLERLGQAQIDTGRIYSLVVFSILSLLPLGRWIWQFRLTSPIQAVPSC